MELFQIKVGNLETYLLIQLVKWGYKYISLKKKKKEEMGQGQSGYINLGIIGK